MGKKSRKYVIDNYSLDVIGKKLEEIIDNMPDVDYDFDFKKTLRDPNYNPPNIESDVEWLIDIYKNILKVELDASDEGHQHWMKVLSNGGTREGVLDYFRNVALKENGNIQSEEKVEFGDLIKNNGNKKALFLLKESAEDIFLCTSLLESFKKSNPDYDIFFSCDPQYHNIVQSNPNIYKVLEYDPQMENELVMIGCGKSDPYFDYYCNLGILTQRVPNYIGIKEIDFQLNE